jgi:putative oxidoreductase
MGGLALGAAASSAAIAQGRRGASSTASAAAAQSDVGQAADGETAGDPVTAVSED